MTKSVAAPLVDISAPLGEFSEQLVDIPALCVHPGDAAIRRMPFGARRRRRLELPCGWPRACGPRNDEFLFR
ncbi:MAG: hypothetical protein LBP86_12040 [Azoarcus sp.]|jgi:hypothetical protein|nr:hypothetical protein [Azoarcus sp.]